VNTQVVLRDVAAAAAHFVDLLDSHSYGQSPPQSDVSAAAVNSRGGGIQGKQNDHGNHTRAKNVPRNSAISSQPG
jgi:hypothetical protein